MKTLKKLIEGTDCHLHEIRFHAPGTSQKGYSITHPTFFTGWSYMGENEIMVFEPTYERNRQGRLIKLWMVHIKAKTSCSIQLVVYCRVYFLQKELQSYFDEFKNKTK